MGPLGYRSTLAPWTWSEFEDLYSEHSKCAIVTSGGDRVSYVRYSWVSVSKLFGHEWHLDVYSDVGQFSSDHRHREFDAEGESNQRSSKFKRRQLRVRDTGDGYREYPGQFPDTPDCPISKPGFSERDDQPGVYFRNGDIHNGRSWHLFWQRIVRKLVGLLSVIGRE